MANTSTIWLPEEVRVVDRSMETTDIANMVKIDMIASTASVSTNEKPCLSGVALIISIRVVKNLIVVNKFIKKDF